MIIIVFGKPGAGKTSLMTHFMTELYEKQGDELLESCQDLIIEQNQERLYALPLPDKPPIFSNFGAKILADYEEEYSPYFFNPYYFGVENDDFPIQYLLPGGYYFIDEAQKYYNSRKSLMLRDHVSRAFETHRQYGMTFILGCQRPKLIDLNIRELTAVCIEVVRLENEVTAYGGIRSSAWYCRKYDSVSAALEYLETGVETGKKIPPIVHNGNIYEAYDSFENRKQFFPKDQKSSGFDLLPFRHDDNLPEEILRFYKPGEPKWFRSKPSEETA